MGEVDNEDRSEYLNSETSLSIDTRFQSESDLPQTTVECRKTSTTKIKPEP